MTYGCCLNSRSLYVICYTNRHPTKQHKDRNPQHHEEHRQTEHHQINYFLYNDYLLIFVHEMGYAGYFCNGVWKWLEMVERLTEDLPPLTSPRVFCHTALDAHTLDHNNRTVMTSLCL